MLYSISGYPIDAVFYQYGVEVDQQA